MTEFDDIAARLSHVEERAAVGALADHIRNIESLVDTLAGGILALDEAWPDDTFAEWAATTRLAADTARTSIRFVADNIEGLTQAEAREEGT